MRHNLWPEGSIEENAQELAQISAGTLSSLPLTILVGSVVDRCVHYLKPL